MDKREEKSIRAIKEAFEKLILEKKYSEITVQNILDESLVGRATFYSHFKSKDDVLKAIVKDIFLHIAAPTKEAHHDFTNEHDYLHLIMHMLCHFKEDRELLNAILQSEGQTLFLERLRIHLTMITKEYMLPFYYNPNVPDGLLLNHLASSLMEIILWWITKDGCIEIPETVTNYYFDLNIPSLTKREK